MTLLHICWFTSVILNPGSCQEEQRWGWWQVLLSASLSSAHSHTHTRAANSVLRCWLQSLSQSKQSAGHWAAADKDVRPPRSSEKTSMLPKWDIPTPLWVCGWVCVCVCVWFTVCSSSKNCAKLANYIFSWKRFIIVLGRKPPEWRRKEENRGRALTRGFSIRRGTAELAPTFSSQLFSGLLIASFAQINYICLAVAFSLRRQNGGGELGGDFICLHLLLRYMRERRVREHCHCSGTASICKKWFKLCYLHKAFLCVKADVRARFLSFFYWIYLFSVSAASAFITAISFSHPLLLPRPTWEHSYSVAVLQMRWSQFLKLLQAELRLRMWGSRGQMLWGKWGRIRGASVQQVNRFKMAFLPIWRSRLSQKAS